MTEFHSAVVHRDSEAAAVLSLNLTMDRMRLNANDLDAGGNDGSLPEPVVHRLVGVMPNALVAFDAFVETWGVKYEKAVECLTKDREALLAFYDFPAEHWKHLRTTNVIESCVAA
jgi:hypothetical protein